MFNTQPTIFGMTNLRSGSMLRPRTQFTAIGIPYEIFSSTTEADTMALRALFDFKKDSGDGVTGTDLVEPKRIRPNMVTRARLR